jgi:dTDP-4-amino-4,6-dideoxygalactose transaminase
MPVHYASNPAGLDATYDFARKHALRVIEDAAHAFGCRHKGRRIGSFGDVICFSFAGIKNITCGEGGCIVTADPEAAGRCRDARLLAVQNDSQARYSGARSWDFDVIDQGYRYHMSNIMAAIGRVQLGRLENEFGPQRVRLAALYREGLADLPGLAFLNREPEDAIIPHIMPVRVLHGRRDAVKAALAGAGIPTGMHYKPNHLLSRYGGGETSLPVTERLYNELMTLPLHPGLGEAGVEQICAVLRKACESR